MDHLGIKAQVEFFEKLRQGLVRGDLVLDLLASLEDETSDDAMCGAIEKLRTGLAEGSSIANSMDEEVFNLYTRWMVGVGETYGILDKAFESVSKWLEHGIQLMEELNSVALQRVRLEEWPDNHVSLLTVPYHKLLK
jgi:type II secretory pathway component PulF